jgi:hypothetical protein
MLLIPYPNTDVFNPMSFDFGLRGNVLLTTSSHNGGMQTIEMPFHRWVCSLTYDISSTANRAAVEAYWASISGQVNRVGLWHIARPVPRGTINQTGVTVLSGVAAGVSTVTFAGAGASNTVRSGDMAAITLANSATQLVMCTADATANGSGQVAFAFAPKLRWSVNTGAAVTLIRPTAKFILTGSEVRVPYEGFIGSGFTVDLVELF